MISRGDCGVHPKAFSVLLQHKPALATALVTQAAEAGNDWGGRRDIAESDAQSADLEESEVRIQLDETPVQKLTFSPVRADLSPPELQSSHRSTPAGRSASGR